MENKEFDNVNSNQNNEAPKNIETKQEELILGKFKNVEELAKAYQNMQTQSGQQSKELGELRKKAEEFDSLKAQSEQEEILKQTAQNYINNVRPKYDKEEYFKNKEFNEIFGQAYNAYGENLDTDKLVSLLDAYAQSRINLYEKYKSANSETEEAKAQMNFSQSEPKKDSSTIPNMSNMNKDEIDRLIAKYI